MTIDQARELKRLVESYDQLLALPDKIRKLHYEKKYDEVANIAFQLADGAAATIETKITRFEKNLNK